MSLTPSSGFPYYISLVKETDFKTLFQANQNFQVLSSVSEEKSTYRYAPDKWSIKQIVGHITDHERIMMYRALRFSRKDSTPLVGYDQTVLVANSRFDHVKYKELLNDLITVRTGTINFMNMLSEEQYQLKGTASGIELSVSDIFNATMGHELHHIQILKERYLVS